MQVSREALVVLGTLVTADSRLKAWFESKIGCVALSQVVNESAIKPDLATMEVMRPVYGYFLKPGPRKAILPNAGPA